MGFGGGFKKWAGGGKPGGGGFGGPPKGDGGAPPPKGPPGAGGPPKPPKPGAAGAAPAPAPTANAGGTGANPQMIARAAQALTRLILEGGLPDDVMDVLSDAQQKCMAAAMGGGDAPTEEDVEGAGEDLDEEEPEEEPEEDPEAEPEGDPLEPGAAAKKAMPPQRVQPAAPPKV